MYFKSYIYFFLEFYAYFRNFLENLRLQYSCMKEEIMNSEKHIKVTGYSNISWKDAIVKTIDEASKTINNLNNVVVLEQRATIARKQNHRIYGRLRYLI